MSNSVSSLNVRIGANTRGLSKGMSRAELRLKKFQGAVNKVGLGLGAAFAGQAVISSIGTGIKKIADFEAEMSKVKAVSQATDREFKLLKQNALDLGANSKFTATQIAEMTTSLARLGFTTPKILDTTDAVRKLATVADAELAESAEIMAGTLNSFNLEASESERVANTMAESFSSTALDLQKFGVSMANVGASANAADVSLERVTAILGVLVDRNIDASKAGTDLRKILTELAVKGISFDDAMDQIQNSTDKVKTAFELFGQRAQTSAIIIADNRDRINELNAGFADTNKHLDDMVAVMEDNLLTDWVKLESAVDGMIQKGGALNPILRNATKEMTSLVNLLNSDNIDFGQKLLGFFGGVGGIRALKAMDQVQGKINELADQKKADQISSTVQAAFDSGNVEAYIKALDNNIYKEEIIAEIREQQAVELKKQNDAIAKQNALNAERLALTQKIRGSAAPDKLVGISTLSPLSDGGAPSFDPLAKQGEKVAEIMRTLNKEMSLATRKSLVLGNATDLLAAKKEMITMAIENLITMGITPEHQAFQSLNMMLQGVMATSDEMATKMTEVTVDLSAAFSDMAVGVAESIGLAMAGVEGLDSIPRALLGSLFDMAGQIGKVMIQTGLAGVALKALFKNPFASIAAGAALVALSSAAKSSIQKKIDGVGSGGGSKVPALAKGGLAFGPTYAMVGDNSNAGVDPEVIAPLSKLKNIMGGQSIDLNGAFVVKGNDLVMILDKQSYRTSRGG